MGIAKVAIVGRPNVGKSSLFNWLAGEKVSIVDSVAGVTRDRVSFLLALDEEETPDAEDFADLPVEGENNVENAPGPRYIELIDTGGIGVVDKDDLTEDVENQIRLAIDNADLILFVTDTRSGIAPLDEIVAEKLRPLSIPILLVANKADDQYLEKNAEEFHRFGWGVIPVSAKQKRGRVHLMDEIEKAVPEKAFHKNEEETADPVMKIAVVGRRNVGKSTFVNTLAQEERVIASPIPGTTRDCVDVRFEANGHVFIAIDTPGFMRRKSIGSDLDFYSLTRAKRSIRRADVVLMFFDASQRISKMDKQLVNLIEEHQRPVIFVVNKWDLMADHMPTSRWGDYLRETFGQCWHVPIAFITGMNGKNVDKLLRQARVLQRQSRLRIPTARLNKIITAALDYNAPPLFHFRKPKIYYAVQADIAPPTIILFCNMPDAFPANYRRYLLSVLRDELPIGEVPIRLIFRKREEKDVRNEIDSKRNS